MDRGQQFPYIMHYRYDPNYPEAEHRIIAIHRTSGGTVGEMHWFDNHPDYGSAVSHISVLPDHQRRGVATAMWNHANHVASRNSKIPVPVHHPQKTPVGHAWAQSLGDTNG